MTYLTTFDNINNLRESTFKGIVHYFNMFILKEQAVYGHHKGAFLDMKTQGEMEMLRKLRANLMKK